MRRTLNTFLFILFLVSCSGGDERIVPVEKSITEAVYSSVTVQPESLYQAFAVVNGILERNLVEEGALVKKGDTILQITNTTSQLNTENARASLELARKLYGKDGAILSSIEEEIAAARLKKQHDSLNFLRQHNLWSQGIGSKAQYEAMKLAYELSTSSLDVLSNKYERTKSELQTQLKQAENNYQLSLVNTTEYSVTSKINGKVYALHRDPGEIITSAQALASVGKAEDFVIEMRVDEVDIVRLERGQKVLVTLDAYQERVFEAEVSKIFPEKDERNQTFLVEALFKNPPKVLYPGLSGEANIITATKSRALVIPRSYLVEGNFVRTSDGLVPVVPGLQSIDSVEIQEGIGPKTEIYKPRE